jgi:ribonuclease BN (tRNA processing enzyme)
VIIDARREDFREGALRWFPERGITSLDAIVLTHGHMDAVAGLMTSEAFRNMSKLPSRRDNGQKRRPESRTCPRVHLSQTCLDDVAERFPWLFPNQQQANLRYKNRRTSLSLNGTLPRLTSKSSNLRVPVVEGLTIVPLPVMHGEDLICFPGFTFTTWW